MDGRKRQLRKRKKSRNKVSHRMMMKRGNLQMRNISHHKKFKKEGLKKRRKERYSLRIVEVIIRRRRKLHCKMSTRWIRRRNGNRMPCLMRAEKLRCSSKLWRIGSSLSVIHHSRCIRSRIKSSSALNTLRQCK